MEEDKSQIHTNDLLRYPFNGKSPTLIHNISFIGYERKNLNKLIAKRQQELLFSHSLESNQSAPVLSSKMQGTMNRIVNLNDLKLEEDQITVDEAPVVLYDQSSDYAQGSIDNDTISSMIYPDKPKIYLQAKKEQVKINEEMSHVIFSFKYCNEDDNDALSLHYFVLKYYDPQVIDVTQYYCPFAICILSQYPFFESFKQLAEELRSIISTNNVIPKEYLLYNIINYIPAPINTGISIQLNTKDKGMIHFDQLSGYPLFQFDISNIVNVLSLEGLIETFVYSFLELDIGFFSKNLVIMNTFMFVIANLNYPFTLSDYFKRIGAITVEMYQRELSDNANDYSQMSGIYTQFSSEFYSQTKIKEVFVVELDKNLTHFHYNCNTKERQEEINKKMAISIYIRNCIKDTKPQSSLFAKAINDLYQQCNSLLQKDPKPSLPLFFKKENEKEIIQMQNNNILIQEAFYSFIVKIMSEFAKGFKIQLPKESNDLFTIDSSSLSGNQSEESIAKEEMILDDFLKQTTKYNLFILNFIPKKNKEINNDISLLFLEEYCYQMITNRRNQLKPLTKYFKAINAYYDIDNNYSVPLDFNQFETNLSQVIINQLVPSSNANTNNDKEKDKDNNYLYFQNRFELLKVIKRKKKINKVPSVYLLHFDNYNNYYNYIENLTQEEITKLFPICSYVITSGEIIQSQNISIDSNTLSQKKKTNTQLLFDHYKGIRSNIKVNEFIKCSHNKISAVIEEELIIQKVIDQNETVIFSFVIFLFSTHHLADNSCSNPIELIYYLLYSKKDAYVVKRLINILIEHQCKVIQTKITNNKEYLIEQQLVCKLIALSIDVNAIPNEEMSHYLDWSINTKIVSIDDIKSNCHWNKKFAHYDFMVENAKINKSPIKRSQGKAQNFLKYNLAQDKKRKYPEYFLALAENTPQYCGNYNVHFFPNVEPTSSVNKTQKDQGSSISKVKTKTTWIVLTQFKHYSTILFSPLKIYRKCISLLNNPGSNCNLILSLCCNLIFYIENINNIFQTNEETKEMQKVVKDYSLDVLYSILLHIENISN